MAKAAEQILRASSMWLGGAKPTCEVLGLASAFVDLQRARHDADYSRRTFTRSEVLAMVGRCDGAVAGWKAGQRTPSGCALMIAILGLKTRS
jgi:hypothetical protein